MEASSSSQLESLSQESRERIAALRKARRERSVEHQARRDSPHTAVVAFSEVVEGEHVGREAVSAAEQKACHAAVCRSSERRSAIPYRAQGKNGRHPQLGKGDQASPASVATRVVPELLVVEESRSREAGQRSQ